MAEQREEPYYDKIKHGRMWAWVYFTGKGGRSAYEVECFRWEKPSERLRWRKNYRYNHEQDFPDVARCLEEADRWIVKHEGGDTPGPKKIEFSLPEVRGDPAPARLCA
jgi:hypothetical protein